MIAKVKNSNKMTVAKTSSKVAYQRKSKKPFIYCWEYLAMKVRTRHFHLLNGLNKYKQEVVGIQSGYPIYSSRLIR